MNSDKIEGNWKQVKGKVKEQWGKLTDDDLDVIAGKRDELLGRIQQRNGIAKEEAERQVETFERSNPNYRFEKYQLPVITTRDVKRKSRRTVRSAPSAWRCAGAL